MDHNFPHYTSHPDPFAADYPPVATYTATPGDHVSSSDQMSGNYGYPHQYYGGPSCPWQGDFAGFVDNGNVYYNTGFDTHQPTPPSSIDDYAEKDGNHVASMDSGINYAAASSTTLPASAPATAEPFAHSAPFAAQTQPKLPEQTHQETHDHWDVPTVRPWEGLTEQEKARGVNSFVALYQVENGQLVMSKHRHGYLSKEDTQTLKDWVNNERTSAFLGIATKQRQCTLDRTASQAGRWIALQASQKNMNVSYWDISQELSESAGKWVEEHKL
ncbi:uncharacterized protein I303_103470 [Kwoniella dejecticola CBS 10117]|uniref:Uncharacterized protein n=1 Tax=Kwoniella dejecticola CBS 10117 TaxID=1296121 RepID=A0A1A6A6U3_9TREE|nr:uncharacterized protein I303_03492 [Kwoniella dejecticola CBS 10117]OBR85780.1 hypothetical protein I303_03492 [Kwoniella dejecticola CBS 10117]